MGFIEHHARAFFVAAGVGFLMFIVFALRSGSAEFPIHFWSLTVRKEEHPVGYWFTIAWLFILSVAVFFRAWTGAL